METSKILEIIVFTFSLTSVCIVGAFLLPNYIDAPEIMILTIPSFLLLYVLGIIGIIDLWKKAKEDSAP